jgi:PEP-CTERM motif
MQLTTKMTLAAATALLAGFTAAQAQVIFNQNFDGGYTGAFGTAAYAGGSPTGTNNAVVATGGNPNGAWTETMTATTWGDYYAGQLQLMTVTGNTDPNPADYVLSFDAKGSGANIVQVGVQSWQNNYFGGSQLINATLTETLAAADTWQTFSVNLGTIAGANPTGATWQLNFQLNSWQWGGPSNTDTLTVDNIVLTQVPEPGLFALAGLGTAVLLVFRRK